MRNTYDALKYTATDCTGSMELAYAEAERLLDEMRQNDPKAWHAWREDDGAVFHVVDKRLRLYATSPVFVPVRGQ